MSAPYAAPPAVPVAPVQPAQRKPAKESWRGWPLRDKIGLFLCWASGLLLCAIAVGIIGYMLVKGLEYLSPELLFTSPSPSVDQSASGGFLDPLIGTVIFCTIGIAIAAPLGVLIALWLTEYGRPFWLARAVESAVEVVAGTPSVVFAIFGLIIFSQAAFGFLSFTADGGAVFGRSFLIAGIIIAIEAVPLVIASTREGLQAIPRHVREASYALGKSKAATIRRVLLPASRPAIATGTVLGLGRIVGDTAVVVILLGASAQLDPVGSIPGLDYLKGTGATLSSYVYNNSPAGEGNAPEKAYAAAFVLLILVLILNFVVARIANNRKFEGWSR